MTPSPFRNFNFEELNTEAMLAHPVAGSHAVVDLLRRAAVACSGPTRFLNNAELAALIKCVPVYDAAPRRITYSDFQSDYPAHLSLEGITAEQATAYNAALGKIEGLSQAQREAAQESEHPTITDLQYAGLRALLLLDETLDAVHANGWTADVADKLLLTSGWISDAIASNLDGARWGSITQVENSREHYAEKQVQQSRKHQTKNARNARHKSNNSAKDKGLEIYKSQSWRSRKEAKEAIANAVKRDTGTIDNWITDWHRN